MEILKTAERYDDIGLAVEKLGLLAEKLFLGQIFLEVIVAELFVDLQLVVEALAGLSASVLIAESSAMISRLTFRLASRSAS